MREHEDSCHRTHIITSQWILPGTPRGWRFERCDRGAWRPFPGRPDSCICGFSLDPAKTETTVSNRPVHIHKGTGEASFELSRHHPSVLNVHTLEIFAVGEIFQLLSWRNHWNASSLCASLYLVKYMKTHICWQTSVRSVIWGRKSSNSLSLWRSRWVQVQ